MFILVVSRFFIVSALYSCNAIRVVSPKVIYLYRKCEEFDLNCVSNRALALRANTPVLCHLLVGSVLPSFLFLSSLVHSVLCCNSEV